MPPLVLLYCHAFIVEAIAMLEYGCAGVFYLLWGVEWSGAGLFFVIF